MFYIADLELSMFTNALASGELSYVIGIIELYFFWSTIINCFSQKKKERIMVGVERILLVKIKDCKTLNITSILICG